jgi:hypothetical protein
MNLLPEKGVGIFVSFNSRGENGAVYGARSRLFDLFMDRYYPAAEPKDPPAIAGAAGHAQAIAGRYESSRRVESGFIALFYLIQQDQVIANADGTISLPSIEGETFREIAPNLWREVGGTRQLMVSDVGGRRTIVDSADPTSVRQAVPLARNSLLNTMIAALSILVLLATVLVWPIGFWLRRTHKLAPATTGRPALAQRLTRVGAVADLAYLFGWYTVLAPLLETKLDVYNGGLDGTIRILQVAAILPLAAAAVGLWNMWLTVRADRGWGAKLRSVIVAAALFGIVWFAWMGNLIGFNLNY